MAVNFFAEAAAVSVGLAPSQYRLGASVRRARPLYRGGNSPLRQALCFPALMAARFNPPVKAQRARLVAAGRPRLIALGAAMRHLLMRA